MERSPAITVQPLTTILYFVNILHSEPVIDISLCPRFVNEMESLFNREIKHHGDFCAVKYCLLRYPECAARWTFGKDESLDACAMFSLLVNAGHMHMPPETNNLDLRLEPLVYCTVDDFPPASKETCQWLQDNFSDAPSWCYYVTAWSIMGDYDLSNLKYAYDHEKLAERLGKTLPQHEITITFSFRKSWLEAYVYDTVEHGDAKLEITNRGMKHVEPSLDNACLLETTDWRAVGGFDESRRYSWFEDL